MRQAYGDGIGAFIVCQQRDGHYLPRQETELHVWITGHADVYPLSGHYFTRTSGGKFYLSDDASRGFGYDGEHLVSATDVLVLLPDVVVGEYAVCRADEEISQFPIIDADLQFVVGSFQGHIQVVGLPALLHLCFDDALLQLRFLYSGGRQ